jgi:hypothetical protein
MIFLIHSSWAGIYSDSPLTNRDIMNKSPTSHLLWRLPLHLNRKTDLASRCSSSNIHNRSPWFDSEISFSARCSARCRSWFAAQSSNRRSTRYWKWDRSSSSIWKQVDFNCYQSDVHFPDNALSFCCFVSKKDPFDSTLTIRPFHCSALRNSTSPTSPSQPMNDSPVSVWVFELENSKLWCCPGHQKRETLGEWPYRRNEVRNAAMEIHIIVNVVWLNKVRRWFGQSKIPSTVRHSSGWFTEIVVCLIIGSIHIQDRINA